MSYHPANSNLDLWAMLGALAVAGLGLLGFDRMKARRARLAALRGQGATLPAGEGTPGVTAEPGRAEAQAEPEAPR